MTPQMLDELVAKAENAAKMEMLADLSTKALKQNELEIAMWLVTNGRTLMEEA